MSAKQTKDLRKQIKRVVEDLLPMVVHGEIYRDLQRQIQKDLEVITKEARETLAQLDKRSQAVQDYIVRQVQLAQTTEPKASTEESK